MKFLRDRHGDPAFIAVEANRSIFQAVISCWQRQQFVFLARKNCKLSKLRLDELECLAKTIHYEADSHEGLFQNSPNLIWLDDERCFGSSDDPCGTAERYVNTYCEALKHQDPGRSITKVRQAISDFITARAAVSTAFDSSDRDKVWVEMILRNKSSTSDGYGIVIVGEDHVKDTPQTLLARLEANGYTCQVRYLANATTPSVNW